MRIITTVSRTVDAVLLGDKKMPFENLLNISVKKDLVDYFAALLTPTIAVAGLYIAFNQRRIEEARLRHELFERRYKQFDAVTKFVLSVISYCNYSDEKFELYRQITKLRLEIAEMQFIFNSEIQDHIDQNIITPCNELQGLRSRYTKMISEEERQNNGARQNEIHSNLMEGLHTFQEKTLKYMQLQQLSSAKELLRYLTTLFDKIKKTAD